MDCGCTCTSIKLTPGGQIEFCPLHKAAPDMLEVLRHIAKGEAPFKIDPLEHAMAGIDEYIRLAKEAIAKATGQGA